MKNLSRAVNGYIALRRALGFKMRNMSHTLADFARFAKRERASRITTELAIRWAKMPQNAHPFTWAARLGMVRKFAVYLCAIDPRTEVPPRDLLPYRYQRKPPRLYEDEEIRQLLAEARKMRSPTGLRAWTYSTFLGLLTVTGMRVGETLELDRKDVDLREGILWVRRTKCRKERLVPVHETTCSALLRYARVRDRVHPRPKTDAFFVGESGLRLSRVTVQGNFVRLSRSVGLRDPTVHAGRGPRLHDLRHRLAVTTLMRWYRSGVDVERRLAALSTYLGHTKVTDTYWYLQATPELLRLALERVEKGVSR